jgi:uncharacterized protein (UPF0333 family)
MKTKIQNKKVLYEKGRILCNGHKLTVEELIKMVEHYLYEVKKLKDIRNIYIDQEKLNYGIRFNMFNIYCTVGKLFELYNEIAQIEGLKPYSKIWYNPSKSIKFSFSSTI